MLEIVDLAMPRSLLDECLFDFSLFPSLKIKIKYLDASGLDCDIIIG